MAVPVPNRCRSLPSFLPCFLGPSTLLYVLAGALGSFCPFSADCKIEPFRLVELRICRYIRKYYICRGAIVSFRCGHSAVFLYVSAEPWCCLKPAGHGFKARVNDFPHSVFILTFAIRIKTPLIAHCLRPSVQSCCRHAPGPPGRWRGLKEILGASDWSPSSRRGCEEWFQRAEFARLNLFFCLDRLR